MVLALVIRATVALMVAVLGPAGASTSTPAVTPTYVYDGELATRPVVMDPEAVGALDVPIGGLGGTAREFGHAYDDRSNRARTNARPGGYRLAPNTTRNFGNYGGEFLDDAIRSPVVRPDLGNLSSKIQRQMGTRGWTPDLIDEAVQQGRAFPAVNKLGGANTPATRYVHPGTGQSVVIDNAMGQVIQVGGPGFRY